MHLERVLTGLLLGAVTIACFLVLQPFLSAMLWAAILVFTTWPLAETLRARLRWPRGLVAGTMVLAVTLIVAVPVALAMPGGAEEIAQLRRAIEATIRGGLPTAPEWLRDMPLLGAWMAGLWDHWAADLSELINALRPHIGTLIDTGLALLLGIANGVLMFLLALFIAFFFYLHGEPIAERLGVALRRTIGPDADRYIALTGATVRGVVYGILGTAIAQGILTSLGLWIAGVPRPMLLGVVAGLLSVLPIGAPLIWFPAALWLLASDQVGWGVFLLVWGVVAISSADNVIRPWFIARGSNMPFLVTVLGVLGGAMAFGLLGVFLGPVVLGLGYTLFNEWARERPSGVT
jgi:predicted PurR-regulated permease PerM